MTKTTKGLCDLKGAETGGGGGRQETSEEPGVAMCTMAPPTGHPGTLQDRNPLLLHPLAESVGHFPCRLFFT